MEDAVTIRRQGSTLWLALVWSVLIVHMSLYPFSGWRSTGVPWHAFLYAPLPYYWTWGDLVRNVLGYMPLGLLLALGQRPQRGIGVALRVWMAGTALSLLMETMQNWLPGRVASNLDLVLNSLGTLLGLGIAFGLQRWGVDAKWEAWKQRWRVVDDPAGGALLAIWPLALLYPLPVAFGLGQVLERAEAAAGRWLQGTPWIAWFPVRAIELQPMLPQVEAALVGAGLCIPMLLGYSLVLERRGRLWLWLACIAMALGMTALAWHMVYGLAEMWTWLWPPVRVGVFAGSLLGLAAIVLPRNACLGIALVLILGSLFGLNDAALPVYDDLALPQRPLGSWYGLVPWLGWVWPFLALGYLLLRLIPLASLKMQVQK